MKTVIRRWGGKISAWLLSRPSNRPVGQLKFPIAFVICVLLAVISLGFVFAQWLVTEKLHSLHTAREVQLAQSLNYTQEMSTCQANAHRATLNVLLASQADEFAEGKAKRLANLNRYLELLEAQDTGNSPAMDQKKKEIENWFLEYSRLSEQVIDLAQDGRMEEALAIRVEKLRPIFDSWQKSQDQFGFKVNLQDSRDQADYLRAIAATRFLLGALFIIPALLVLLGILALVALLGFQHLRGRYADPKDTWAH